jgi:hypothetical protein
MPDDNILPFRRPPTKPPVRQPGKPSLLVAIVAGAVTLAILAAIYYYVR